MHVHPVDPGYVFAALTDQRERRLRLAPGEVAPVIVEAIPNSRVVWSSLWPVSPNDRIEFELTRRGSETAVRYRWFSESPPDERGIAITRYRLNLKSGGDLRSDTGYSG